MHIYDGVVFRCIAGHTRIATRLIPHNIWKAILGRMGETRGKVGVAIRVTTPHIVFAHLSRKVAHFPACIVAGFRDCCRRAQQHQRGHRK